LPWFAGGSTLQEPAWQGSPGVVLNLRHNRWGVHYIIYTIIVRYFLVYLVTYLVQ
jgi:hypothetical protein